MRARRGEAGHPVAHVEAGLRSYDNRMPEEHNRVLTDHLSSVLLAHPESALDNLAREGIDLELAHFVGNTMIDSVFAHVDAARAEKPWEALGVEPGDYGLVTLHRPALVDDPALLTATVEGLKGLAATYPIVFPVHPRTRQHLVELGLESGLPEARVLRQSSARLPALPRTAGRSRLPAHGLWRRAGGDVRARCPLLHAARLDGATRHGRARHEHRARRRPDRIAEIPSLLEQERPAREIPLWDGAAGPRAAETLLHAIG